MESHHLASNYFKLFLVYWPLGYSVLFARVRACNSVNPSRWVVADIVSTKIILKYFAKPIALNSICCIVAPMARQSRQATKTRTVIVMNKALIDQLTAEIELLQRAIIRCEDLLAGAIETKGNMWCDIDQIPTDQFHADYTKVVADIGVFESDLIDLRSHKKAAENKLNLVLRHA